MRWRTFSYLIKEQFHVFILILRQWLNLPTLYVFFLRGRRRGRDCDFPTPGKAFRVFWTNWLGFRAAILWSFEGPGGATLPKEFLPHLERAPALQHSFTVSSNRLLPHSFLALKISWFSSWKKRANRSPCQSRLKQRSVF